MSTHHADDAINELTRVVARATVDLCVDRLVERHSAHALARDLLKSKDQLADEIVGVMMETADEVAEHPVHDLRSVAG